MAWTDAIADIIGRYSGAGGGAAAAPADPHQDYCSISQSAPPQVMADALAHSFRSDQTPSFPEMVSSLFQGSSPEQQAGLLNHLAAAVGPAALASIPALKKLMGSPSGEQPVTAATASQITPDQVQRLAQQAQSGDPSIVDQVSGFYARHPDVIQALGGTAIAVALQHIARRR
jgi:hypothetical protein